MRRIRSRDRPGRKRGRLKDTLGTVVVILLLVGSLGAFAALLNGFDDSPTVPPEVDIPGVDQPEVPDVPGSDEVPDFDGGDTPLIDAFDW